MTSPIFPSRLHSLQFNLYLCVIKTIRRTNNIAVYVGWFLLLFFCFTSCRLHSLSFCSAAPQGTQLDSDYCQRSTLIPRMPCSYDSLSHWFRYEHQYTNILQRQAQAATIIYRTKGKHRLSTKEKWKKWRIRGRCMWLVSEIGPCRVCTWDVIAYAYIRLI